jgi:hypothetical protein
MHRGAHALLINANWPGSVQVGSVVDGEGDRVKRRE